MTPPYYILEHPTRGVLRDLEKTKGGRVGRFSVTGPRGGDLCMRFATVEEAAHARERLPTRISAATDIRCSKANAGVVVSHWPVVQSPQRDPINAAVYVGEAKITFIGTAPPEFNPGAPEISDLWDEAVQAARAVLEEYGYRIARIGYGSQRKQPQGGTL